MLSVFLKSLLIGYSGAVMPGPMLTYTVNKSMKHGVKAGVLVSLGHAFLELILVMLILAGAGTYLSGDKVKAVVGIAGGLVLGYLGFSMIRDVWFDRVSPAVGADEKGGRGNALLAGVVLSITNPYFTIWWTAVGLALSINAYNAYGIMGVAAFYTGHVLADISWFSLVAALIGKTRHLLDLRAYKIIIVVLAVCLLGFGTSFLIGGMRFVL